MLDVVSPYDLKSIAQLPFDTDPAAKMEIALAQKPLPLAERIEILRRAKRLVQERQEELVKTAALEGGKPYTDSKGEVVRAIQGIDCAIATMSTKTGTMIPMGINAASQERLAFTLREPIGVVLAISAFNHPFNPMIHQVITAVAAGCPVLVKPDLRTPLSAKNLVEILYEAGLPPEQAQLLICTNEETEELVAHPKLAFLSFIGSAAVGWKLRSLLAAGAACALEHGGAAPVIALPDANIDEMLPPLLKGGFYHAGQVCVSVQRLFVHRPKCQEVVDKLVAGAEKLIVGDPLDPKTEVGPLILPRELKRIDGWVQEAGNIQCGGRALSDTCYAPTVILDPDPNCKLSTNEVFGPVVAVYPYDEPSEAVSQANALPFTFQAAVFGKTIDPILETAQQLKGTAVMVNDHTAFRVDWMPFGGAEQSGLRMGGIPYTIDDLWREKLIVIRSKGMRS